MKNLSWPVTRSETLERHGSKLVGRDQLWNMLAVHGPLELPEADGTRQYFRIETTRETLVVYRGMGERGMRKLTLFAVMNGMQA